MKLSEIFSARRLGNILEKMDRLVWYRMLVLVLPPLCFSRLMVLLEVHPLLQACSTLLVFAGFAIFVFWSKIRTKMSPEEPSDDEESSETEESPDSTKSPDHRKMLDAMQKMCNGDMNRVHRAIDKEFDILDNGDYGYALESAFKRMRYHYNRSAEHKSS